MAAAMKERLKALVRVVDNDEAWATKMEESKEKLIGKIKPGAACLIHWEPACCDSSCAALHWACGLVRR